MGRFDGTVAWVTGGASGIGLATAQRFAEEGARVVISDMNKEASEEAVAAITGAGGEAVSIPCDVRELSQCVDTVRAIDERWGRLDSVFANAGILGVGLVEFVEEDDFLRVLDVNLNGVFRTAKAAMPLLKRSGGGAIVMTSSVEGLVGNMMLAAYSTSKTALVGLCRSLAHEGGPFGVRATCIHPGYIETPMTEPVAAMNPDFKNEWIAKTPLGRPGKPSDVAAVVAFLCSPDAAYVTGTGVVVDGGTLAIR